MALLKKLGLVFCLFLSNFNFAAEKKLLEVSAGEEITAVLFAIEAIKGKGGSLDTKGDHGYSALFCAIYYGRVEAVRLLVDFGADTQGALHFAAMHGKVKIMELLLQREDIEADTLDSEGVAALHYAAACEQEEAVKLLLLYGADIDLKDDDGNTALHFLVVPKTDSYFHDLIRNYSLEELNLGDNEKRLSLRRFLLGEGANPNLQNNADFTPKALAKDYGEKTWVFVTDEDLSHN